MFAFIVPKLQTLNNFNKFYFYNLYRTVQMTFVIVLVDFKYYI